MSEPSSKPLPNIVAVLQARMTSSRLPGKILMPVAGKPLLAYQLERLQRVPSLQKKIIVATTRNATDDPVIALCESLGVAHYRGDEQDVLERFHDAARQQQATVVVRVTGDCPLLDPHVVEQAIQLYLTSQPVDYVSNSLQRTFPRGLDVEVFSFEALKTAHKEATDSVEREHVTPFIYRRPERFKMRQLTQSPDVSHLRWTVDTPEDFQLIERILSTLYPNNPTFSQQDVLNLLAQHPDWSDINAHIEQVKVESAKTD